MRVLAASGRVTGGGTMSCYNNGGVCSASFSGPVTFAAAPDAGFSVKSWSGCTASADKSTCSVPGTASTVVFISFQAAPPPPPPPNTISVRVLSPSGAVTGGPIDCYDNNGTCAANLTSPVTLTAIPDSGFTVQGWTGCTAGPGQTTCAVPGNASAVVSVSFQSAPPPPPSAYTLIARVLAASGTVTGGGISCTDNTGTCSYAEPVGATIDLAAVPTSGFAVKSWYGCTPTANLLGCSVAMDATKAVSVTFGSVPQVVTCIPANGTAGTQTWNPTANAYDPCVATACNPGYSLSNGACITAIYAPFGPQLNVPVAELTGWAQCFSDAYGTPLPTASVLASCTGSKLMLACRPVGSSVLAVLAWAPREDVTYALPSSGPTRDTPHVSNGSGWYFTNDWSWGFAREGDPIARNSCDVAGFGDATGPYRLCWHTHTWVGGYRCGNMADNSSTTWERVVYQAD